MHRFIATCYVLNFSKEEPMKKISIIIPTYNGADNLRAHLGNVINQTLSDIEIIIVNDASTDDTLRVAKDAETQFPDKVKVIDSPTNNGAGGARNLGLAEATGEYIGFIDCDDLVEPTMYEKLYQAAKSYSDIGADVVDSGYYYQAQDNAIVHTSDEMTGEMDIEKRKAHIVAGGYIVTKLFRREFLQKAFADGEYFRKNCILEDSDFLGVVFSKMQNCVNVKEVLYYYLDAADSSSKTTNPVKYIANINAAVEAIYEKVSVIENYEDLKEAFEYEMAAMLINGLLMVLSDYLENKVLDTKKEIDNIIVIEKKVITIDLEKNKYIQAKVSQQDLEIFGEAKKDLDNLLTRISK